MISRGGTSSWWTDVACARGMGGLWTTFFFIVMWIPPFEVLFLVVLGCPGLCLDVLLICMIVGGPLASQRVLQCEKWCLHASFGVCRGKWMIKTEDKERTLGEILSLFYETLYLWTAACLLCRLVIVTSLFILFFLIRWFLLYTSCVRRDALRFQWD